MSELKIEWKKGRHRGRPAPIMKTTQGCLLGVAIGDVYGQPRGTSGRISGRYSDDTQMTLALAEALIDEGMDSEGGIDIDPGILAKYFAERYEPDRDYGPNVDLILQDIRAGMPWDKAVAKNKPPGGSWGNGSAMRVAPIAIAGKTLHWVEEAARRQCAATGHTHPEALEYTAIFAKALWKVLQGASRSTFPLQALNLLVGNYDLRGRIGSHRMDWVVHNLEATPRQVATALGNGMKACEAVPCAIWAFMSGFQDGPMAVIERAMQIGGDSDTIGAMAGALVGAYYGLEDWPKEVVEQIENGEYGRDYILSMADDLAEVSGRTHWDEMYKVSMRRVYRGED